MFPLIAVLDMCPSDSMLLATNAAHRNNCVNGVCQHMVSPPGYEVQLSLELIELYQVTSDPSSFK